MGQTSCDLCPAGKHGTANEAQTEAAGCRDCEAGTYSTIAGISSREKCVGCLPGKYGQEVGASSDPCKNCELGTYSAAAGKTECDVCAEYTVTDGEGKTFCSACEAGKSYVASSKACEPCAVAKYSEAAAASCLECPRGRYVNGQRSGCDA